MNPTKYEDGDHRQNLLRLREQVNCIGQYNCLIRKMTKPNLLEKLTKGLRRKDEPSALELFMEQKKMIAEVFHRSVYMEKNSQALLRDLEGKGDKITTKLNDYKKLEEQDDEKAKKEGEEGVEDLERVLTNNKNRVGYLKGANHIYRKVSLKSERMSEELDMDFRFNRFIDEQRSFINYVINTVPTVNSFVTYCQLTINQGMLELETLNQTYSSF